MFKSSWFILVKKRFPAVFLWPKTSVQNWPKPCRRCAISWQPCPMVLWQPSTKPTCGSRLKARWAKHFWCWRRRKKSKRQGVLGQGGMCVVHPLCWAVGREGFPQNFPLHTEEDGIPFSESHLWTIWKGSHNARNRGLTITMIINHLQVMGWSDPPSTTPNSNEKP